MPDLGSAHDKAAAARMSFANGLRSEKQGSQTGQIQTRVPESLSHISERTGLTTALSLCSPCGVSRNCLSEDESESELRIRIVFW
jgi:hypothetical protein